MKMTSSAHIEHHRYDTNNILQDLYVYLPRGIDNTTITTKPESGYWIVCVFLDSSSLACFPYHIIPYLLKPQLHPWRRMARPGNPGALIRAGPDNPQQ